MFFSSSILLISRDIASFLKDARGGGDAAFIGGDESGSHEACLSRLTAFLPVK